MRLLVLIKPKMSGCVKIFEGKDGDKDKNNKVTYCCMDDENLLGKYKAIWTNIENLKMLN